MDDEDGRCLLDVICDPQALNDFLHGSEKIDSDDLLDSTGDAASAFFEGAGLHVQESSGNHLTAEQSQPSASVDLDFLEDDILGSPAGGGANLPSSEQPCDILQQSLQEANITEQTLEAEAELDLGSFQLPTLQPVVQAASDGAPQIFSGGADLIGLQQPAVLTHQALVQQSVGADVVNKAISVQPFLQQVGLGNVTIQPISNLQGLPNGSPGGALGIGPIQVVGQQVMAINQPAQQIIAKQVQPSQVATVPVGSYITQTAPEQQQVALTSAGVSPQGAGLVIQKNLPAVATTTLNGSSVFGGVSGAQGSQPLTVTSNLSSPLVQAQNVIIHRTPTPIQPKPAGVLQQKLYQITPKPFGSNNATLTIQNEAALQQQKAQQNLTFMAGKPAQNVVLSGFPQGLPANVFKQPPPQQQALSKPMSVHLLNQGSSIVIPAQHVPQAMLQGQNQFLLPGQLAGAPAVQIPQQLSALPANVGGQILAASHGGGQAHIITSQGPGGQLIANQALPAQILTNQNIAGQLNLGPVLASQNAHGTAHILSAPIQLQPGQVGQPALFQMPVSLAGSLTTQSQPSVAAPLPGAAAAAIGQTGQTVIQGVTLPSQVAMLNAADNLGQAVSIQPSGSSQSPGLLPPQPAPTAGLLPAAAADPPASILAIQPPAAPPAAPAPLQLSVQPPPPAPPPAPLPAASQPSPGLAASPEKIILGQAAAGAVINQDSMQMFLQQVPQGIILQTKQQTPTSQASPALSQFSSQSSSVLVSSQGQPVTVTATPTPAHSHAPTAGPPSSAGGTAPPPSDSKPFSSAAAPIAAGKGPTATGKPGATLAMPQPVQTKPGVISSVSGLNLGKGPLQIQVVGKGLSQLVPSVQSQQLYDSKLGSLKKTPTLQPSKEACFLEQLHKHQGAVLHPDYKTSFHSFEDALQRLLPYHVYQGMLPSAQDYRKVDEEFEVVSTQLLKRTQAMLNKYRLLLLEESRRVSPSAEMVMIDRMFIQEEKTMLALDKQLAKEKPDEYVSSSSRSQSLSLAAAQPSSSSSSSSSGLAPAADGSKAAAVQTATAINPTKLVIKHSGGSPSVTWAKASPSLDGDDDALPSRSKPPIKTYEARSRIGLKLKIKQEAGLSKVVHNTALDPVHQPPPVCRVIKAAEQHPAAGQMNGTLEHGSAAPPEKKAAVSFCRLPLRKTYRENVDAFVAEKPTDKGSGAARADKAPLKQEDGTHKGPEGAAADKGRAEESSKLLFFGRGDARPLVLHGSPVPQKSDDPSSGLMKELAEVEEEFYHGMIKTEPPDHGPGAELTWEVPLPPTKRRKSESFEVDNASFSSDSPQDDSLNEHLQSAIDSILNLQQPQTGGQNVRTPSSSYNSSSSPFSSPVHRTDAYLAPNHNGGLGARTLNR
ncbi:BRD4-interacting chromatin-remodeling complex-associated protein isoform X1 [Gallus gallus]|uniref:BRD4-interacting chromatin-remodeling complex-associated protein isoform X1 n=1 Tax=Gallus gallus TaxID=9031 RepID=UPI001AE79480|nr:BRD4-interacting chromatin-remodeling complex-associated protein isoform X1 [Gallus gallus]XP_040550872.1 BRD4-interacting chromatin-remodeling complex-associated protein isoform X1 [Gallus gallus]XP_046793604.1 BRD4-interacting chromatin-remodeling complex-associated protein isoform X1 [Gallus gallus]